jgi:hypothetical protein
MSSGMPRATRRGGAARSSRPQWGQMTSCEEAFRPHWRQRTRCGLASRRSPHVGQAPTPGGTSAPQWEQRFAPAPVCCGFAARFICRGVCGPLARSGYSAMSIFFLGHCDLQWSG